MKTVQSFLNKKMMHKLFAVTVLLVLGLSACQSSGNPKAGENSEPAKGAISITDANFQKTISKGIVLVDFWATWCPPCRIQGPIVDELAKEIGDKATITKLDVDHNKNAANTYGITNIPTLIIFKDGKEVKRFVGVQQKETLKQTILSLM